MLLKYNQFPIIIFPAGQGTSIARIDFPLNLALFLFAVNF
jgi:hypothetical protein